MELIPPIRLDYIQGDVLNSVVNYMKNIRGNVDIIPTILAANYLDIKDLIKVLFDLYKRNKYRYSNIETYDNDGFFESERRFIHSRRAHLQDIHVEVLRTTRTRYSLLDVPKDLIRMYYFDRYTDYNFGFRNWFNELIEFRTKHVYFWHVTTNYIIQSLKEHNPKLNSFSDDQVFDMGEYKARRGSDTRLGTYALKKSEAPNFDQLDGFEKLIIAIKKHGSIAQMELAAEKLQSARDRYSQKTKDKKELIETNKTKIKEYITSLGFYTDARLPVIDHEITNMDPEVQNYLFELSNRVNQFLNPLDLVELGKWVYPTKLKQLLMGMDSSREKEIDAQYDRYIKFLKDRGFEISRYEIDLKKSPEQILADKEAKRDKLISTRERLRQLGLDVDDNMIILHHYDVQTIARIIKSSSLETIRKYSTSWEAFLKLINDK
jgi:hypothetical protein